MAGQNAVVALIDSHWFEFLQSVAVDGRLDEVNFWRPLAQTEFRPLAPERDHYRSGEGDGNH
ncbi:MAG: hypothetical protein MUP14_08885 [Dehalococcoidia bacterium]|nr:hypothetical protein [Dehalococcoidia bacterium]